MKNLNRMFFIFGKKPKYSTFTWWENWLGGHISIGRKITIFGSNAMYWVLNIYTKKGALHITLPAMRRKGHRRHCIYLSPNGTPWACTFYIGHDKSEQIRARIRKLNFGHGFDVDKYYHENSVINDKFYSFRPNEYEVEAKKAEWIKEYGSDICNK